MGVKLTPGSFGLGVSIAGGGLVGAMPSHTSIGWAVVALGLTIVLYGVRVKDEPLWTHSKAMFAIGTVTIMLLCGGLWMATKPAAKLAISAPPATKRQASIYDLESQLVIDGVEGSAIKGRFLLRNKGDATFTLSTIQFDIPGNLLTTINDEAPRTIAPGRNLELTLVEANSLAESGALALRFDYALDGVQSPKSAFVAFVIPHNFKSGQILEPTQCCELGLPGLAQSSIQERERLLNLPESGINQLFLESEGLDNIRGGGKQLVFNPAQREIAFLIYQGGVQKVFHHRMKQTIDGVHLVYVGWQNAENRAFMYVNGEPAKLLDMSGSEK